ncbi:MAG: 16S rRNA (adenine(1518)-N(6)/adenine(1519)-N(6))-dimethyltransferase RsmA [Bacteroidia bacterium]|nr:16S rRNA (adenine(1518)-N(6)/adenine(1519)-N(6))-dimethyltransferase RsmA [Bacteroidia bacterium]
MKKVTAKKYLGQHFLKDPEIAGKITGSLMMHTGYRNILEVGPGMGILSVHLFGNNKFHTRLIEVDQESVQYLMEHFPDHREDIIQGDFLLKNIAELFDGPFGVIGNFPYNISSQILFRILDYRNLVPEVVGMFQKEVAERIASPPCSREYGILSVFMQAFYNVEYLFTLNEEDFTPPPNVKSGVLHFIRKEDFNLGCNERKFRLVVRTGFSQRRKTLKNALSAVWTKDRLENLPYMNLRAEALSWSQFVELANLLDDDFKI